MATVQEEPLNLSYRTTLESLDKETGEHYRKVWKDGVLIEQVVLNKGSQPALAEEV